MTHRSANFAERSSKREWQKKISPGYASRPGGRRRTSESWRYAAACFDKSSYTHNVGLPSLYMKYSAIEAPEYGAMYSMGAGSDADAATMIVYSSAPVWRSRSTTEAIVDAFCPMAT